MKIKTIPATYEKAITQPPMKKKKPKRPNLFFRTLMRVASIPDLRGVRFSCKKTGMDRLAKKEPCLFLMNHTCFMDMEIAATVLYPRPFNIICASDGFVGKPWLMRQVGCIPTQKFVSDLSMVRDAVFAAKKLKNSILLYPEAGYSFDGTATTISQSTGSLVKLLGLPVAMIRTYGAFQRQPLYNELRKRRVQVSAEVTYLLSPQEVKEKTAEEIQQVIKAQFAFDYFAWQKENQVEIIEPDRAVGLERVLYQCPHCGEEGRMKTQGDRIFCPACQSGWRLSPLGDLVAENAEAPGFDSIPAWYRWQRETVRSEVSKEGYSLSAPVKIGMLLNAKGVYTVGDGILRHDGEGFHLEGCDGALSFHQPPLASHSVYADFLWYELGDVVCVGDKRALYCCFPEEGGIPVAKFRLAAEELFKILSARIPQRDAQAEDS